MAAKQKCCSCPKKCPDKQRLCVIGAGAAGLAVARHFTTPTIGAGGVSFCVTVFEQTSEIGGTWVYNETAGVDQYGLPVHSSMYRNLRTNLPKELMAYLDYPFQKSECSFLGHWEVLQYLKDYSQHFNLIPLIRFRSLVKRVRPLPLICDTEQPTWEVQVEDIVSKQASIWRFDAIAVCNGRYSVPHYPPLNGLNTFQGILIHSHHYRTPDRFAGKTVACLGAASSGSDIAIDVATVAKTVFLCHHGHRLRSPLPANVHEMIWPVHCDHRCLTFVGDGGLKMVVLDAIVVCTGYEYSYPFLEGEASIQVNDNMVMPLYDHFLHTRCFPKLAIFGVPYGVVPFTVYDVLSRVFRQLLEGTLTVVDITGGGSVTAQEMEEETRRALEAFVAEGSHRRHFHKLGPDNWAAFLNEMTTRAGLPPISPALHDCFRKVTMSREKDLVGYRNVTYHLTETTAIAMPISPVNYGSKADF